MKKSDIAVYVVIALIFLWAFYPSQSNQNNQQNTSNQNALFDLQSKTGSAKTFSSLLQANKQSSTGK